MKANINFKQSQRFFTNNWFSISIGALFLIALMQKDINMQFHVGQPEQGIEQKDQEEKIPLKKKRQTRLSTLSASNPLRDLKPKKKRATKKKKGKDFKLDDKTAEQYISRFSHVAVKEMEKFQVPASITLAQALLDSRAGQVSHAKTTNNHFSLTCSSDWAGSYENSKNTCYRSYESAWTSFRDHSQYLNTGKFKNLRFLPNNYKDWANGLEVAGYSKKENYAKQLIELIEKYDLQRFDS